MIISTILSPEEIGKASKAFKLIECLALWSFSKSFRSVNRLSALSKDDSNKIEASLSSRNFALKYWWLSAAQGKGNKIEGLDEQQISLIVLAPYLPITRSDSR